MNNFEWYLGLMVHWKGSWVNELCICKPDFNFFFYQKILYSKISEDLGNSCVYILEKLSHAAGMPVCVFTASQENDVEKNNIAVQLAVNFQV